MSEERRQDYARFSSLNLTVVANRIRTEQPAMDHQTIAEGAEEYRKFLFLASLLHGSSDANVGLAPSKIVDEFWHAHVLFTRKYFKDCDEFLGRYLHHSPELTPGPESKSADAYKNTLDFYSEVFQTAPPPAIWPKQDVNQCAANCNTQCTTQCRACTNCLG